MPTIDLPTETNIRAPAYCIARASGSCVHCREPTPLVALVLPRSHEILEPDADADADANADADTRADAKGDDSAADSWQVAQSGAFLFHVEYLSHAVQKRLREVSLFFRPAHSEATMSTYWMNHCERCGVAQEDNELFCEPDGAFLPTSPAGAAAIRLLEIPEPFEAAAAGYAIEPAFFEFMRRT
jgi:hypothetical protein